MGESRQVAGEHAQHDYLQHLTVETKELILRLPLYLYLHSSVLKEHTEVPEGEDEAA
jgi:hypothetical protein